MRLWGGAFDCLRKAFEARTGELGGPSRWTELVTKGTA